MSLISFLVNDRLSTAQFGVACCVVLTAVGCSGLTDGNGLDFSAHLLVFAVLFVPLLVGLRLLLTLESALPLLYLTTLAIVFYIA